MTTQEFRRRTGDPWRNGGRPLFDQVAKRRFPFDDGRGTIMRESMSKALDEARRRQDVDVSEVRTAIAAGRRDRLQGITIRRTKARIPTGSPSARKIRHLFATVGILACMGLLMQNVPFDGGTLTMLGFGVVFGLVLLLPPIMMMTVNLPEGVPATQMRPPHPTIPSKDVKPTVEQEPDPGIAVSIAKHSPEDAPRAEGAVNRLNLAARTCIASKNGAASGRMAGILSKVQDLHREMRSVIEVVDADERRRICSEATHSLETLARAADEERALAVGEIRKGFDRQRRYIEASHPDDGGLSSIP